MAEHLIDVDDDTLEAARTELRTRTIEDTVNEALRRVASGRAERTASALHVLATIPLHERAVGWR